MNIKFLIKAGLGLWMMQGCITHVSAMTLEQAIAATIENHPKISAAQAQVRAIEFERQAAAAGKKPTVKMIAGLSQGGALDNLSDGGNRQGVELSYTLYDAGRTQYSIDQKQVEKEGSVYELEGQEEGLILGAIEAYIQVVKSQEAIRLANDYVRKNKEVLVLVRDLVKVRLRDRSELELANARYEQAQISVTQKEMELATAKTELKRIVGEDVTTLSRPEAVNPRFNQFDDLFELASQHNTSLKALASERQSLKIQKKLADTWNKPNVIVRAQLARDSSKKSSDFFLNDNSVSMDVEWSLYDGNAGKANAMASNELLIQALENEKDKVRDVRDEVQKVWLQYKDRQATDTLNKRNTKASQKVVEATRQQFKLGKKSLLDVINVERELYQARETELTGEYELLSDGYRVLAAQGGLKEHFTVHDFRQPQGVLESENEPYEEL